MSGRAPCPCCGGLLPAGAVPREEIAGLVDCTSAVFRTIVRRLAWRPGHWVATAELVEHLWRDDPDGGPDRAEDIVRQTIGRHRKRLFRLGWTIEAGWNRWRLAAIGGQAESR